MITEDSAKMYFEWSKGKIIGGAIFAVILAVGFFSNGNWILGIIAIIVVIGLICALIAIPSDEDIDASFDELAEIRVKESLDKLGLEEGDTIREPLTIIGVGNYEYEKEGSDGWWRFNPMVVEVIHFGKNQLLTNTVQLDLLNQKSYVGKTNEFFYKDISAVSIEDDNSDDAVSKHFIIKVHGQVELDTGIEEDQEEAAEEAVKTIRKMLREKKQD